MDESDGDQLKHFYQTVLITLLMYFGVTTSLLASGLGGFAGTTNRFAADPLAAGTGGITLFQETSTNSYAQNPATQAFATQRRFDAGLAQLSLDRFLYSISASQPLPPTANLSVGVIAGGTRNIQARDSRGISSGMLSDTELTYLASFSIRLSEHLALGVNFKLLSKQLSSEGDLLDLKGSGFGAGIGAIIKPRRGTTFAVAIKDWNSSYKWKTEDLFERGSSYTDKFPLSFSWGWLQEIDSYSLALEHDFYFIGENIYRASIMWHRYDALLVNTGFSFEDKNIFPGLSARYQLSLKKGPPMHIDLGLRLGLLGEDARTFLGWGVNF